MLDHLKKVDGFTVMEKFTGIPVERLRQMAQEVHANHQRLDKCVGPHDFQKVEGDVRHMICTLCGGRIDTKAYHYYLIGLNDGLKKAEAVILTK